MIVVAHNIDAVALTAALMAAVPCIFELFKTFKRVRFSRIVFVSRELTKQPCLVGVYVRVR